MIPFLLLRKNTLKWVSPYFKFLALLLIVQGFLWVFRIEDFAYAMLPIFIALGIRYAYLSKYLNNTN